MRTPQSILPLFRGRRARKSDAEHYRMTHIPGFGWQNHLVAACGEFVGTFFFLFMAFTGTSVANVPSRSQGDQAGAAIAPPETGSNPEQLLYISLSFGFSLAVNVWVFFRISGGLFNPVVTLALWLVGGLPGRRALVIFLAQIVAGIVSAAIVNVLFPTALGVTTTLGAGTTQTQGLFIEAFLTFQLVFTVLMLAAEKHKATFLAPIGIGLALFISELAGVYYTGGSLNPTRSFGPAAATRSFPREHWIYWVGPTLGALAASAFYMFVKRLKYEDANPGQDRDPEETVVTVRNAVSRSDGDSLQARGGDRDVVVEVEPAAGFSPVVQRALEQGSQRIDMTGRR